MGKWINKDTLGSVGKHVGGLANTYAPRIPGIDYQLLGEYGGEQLGGLFRRGGAVRRRRVVKRGKGRK